MKLIRKITIGKEYKQDCMVYSVGKSPFRNAPKMKDFVVHAIQETDDGCDVFLEKHGEVYPWKTFNNNMAISLEYDIDSYEEST